MLTTEQKNILKVYSAQTIYSYEDWLIFAEYLRKYDVYFDDYFNKGVLKAYYDLSVSTNRSLLEMGIEHSNMLQNSICGLGAIIRDLKAAITKEIVRIFMT